MKIIFCSQKESGTLFRLIFDGLIEKETLEIEWINIGLVVNP